MIYKADWGRYVTNVPEPDKQKSLADSFNFSNFKIWRIMNHTRSHNFKIRTSETPVWASKGYQKTKTHEESSATAHPKHELKLFQLVPRNGGWTRTE